jgi:hypothetical protein
VCLPPFPFLGAGWQLEPMVWDSYCFIAVLLDVGYNAAQWLYVACTNAIKIAVIVLLMYSTAK